MKSLTRTSNLLIKMILVFNNARLNWWEKYLVTHCNPSSFYRQKQCLEPHRNCDVANQTHLSLHNRHYVTETVYTNVVDNVI